MCPHFVSGIRRALNLSLQHADTRNLWLSRFGKLQLNELSGAIASWTELGALPDRTDLIQHFAAGRQGQANNRSHGRRGNSRRSSTVLRISSTEC